MEKRNKNRRKSVCFHLGSPGKGKEKEEGKTSTLVDTTTREAKDFGRTQKEYDLAAYT